MEQPRCRASAATLHIRHNQWPYTPPTLDEADMNAAESSPGTTAVKTPATMTSTPPDTTPEPPMLGADAEVGGAGSRPDGAGASFPEDGVAGAATGAGAPRPMLHAVGRQLADNAIVILLTGVVVAVMSFGFESLGSRIDDTNARIDSLDASIGARINDTDASIGARIDDLSRAVAENGQRLARIEGFLGIGMPGEAAARAPGASLGSESDPVPEGPAQSGGEHGD